MSDKETPTLQLIRCLDCGHEDAWMTDQPCPKCGNRCDNCKANEDRVAQLQAENERLQGRVGELESDAVYMHSLRANLRDFYPELIEMEKREPFNQALMRLIGGLIESNDHHALRAARMQVKLAAAETVCGWAHTVVDRHSKDRDLGQAIHSMRAALDDYGVVTIDDALALTPAQSDAHVGDGWLPIENAPKDGSSILGRSSSGGLAVVEWWQSPNETGYWSLTISGVGCYDSEWWPEEWMPLPAPPRALLTATEGDNDNE